MNGPLSDLGGRVPCANFAHLYLPAELINRMIQREEEAVWAVMMARIYPPMPRHPKLDLARQRRIRRQLRHVERRAARR